MRCSRCALVLLLLEQISAAVTPRSSRSRRDVPDEFFPHRADTEGLSAGDEGRARGRVFTPDTESIPTETSTHQSQNHKASHKRRKVATLDSISRFQIPSVRTRKEKASVYREH